ncbi:MAG TPA: acyl-CoA dehydrogenase family protein [Acidimicrobiales bacterium]|jgi:alkylation response protein AidB-like acyl-CoA dehydrogenase|nr:acyl-CoA dehydrogenase family protein [Acidimicrobiales bacterium]
MGEGSAAYDEAVLRREVRSWIAANWDPDLTVREWWRRLADAGWGFPTWPREWFGRGLPEEAAEAVHDELARAGVLGPPEGGGPSMAAPAVFAFGNEEQKARFLPAIARGEEFWAQFFSEPGAGSDLASVQARAVRDGNEWIVNGQKVWNSCTLSADRALLVARTDVDVPKHKGIGFFVIDIDQPGVDIRPIKQMNGRAEFNEAFLTDARVPDANRIGDANGGWAVAMTVLTNERANFAGGGGATPLRSIESGAKFGHLDRRVGDVLAEDRPPGTLANGLAIGTIDAVIDLARQHRRLADPVIRQRIAALHAFSEALRLTELRGRAAARAGRGGGESSITYLGGVQMVRMYRDLVAEIAGAYALLGETTVAETITTAPAHGIQGGTEQIQRNVIGERLLGLPREPQVDRDVPFRDVRVGTQRS